MKQNIRKFRMILIFGFCIMAGMLFKVHQLYAEKEERELVITVVEEIPAEEIYDEEVPMAALPYSKNQNGTRHLLMMSSLLVLSCAYIGYFHHYEKRIETLRAAVIEKEEELMQKRNNSDRKGKSDE